MICPTPGAELHLYSAWQDPERVPVQDDPIGPYRELDVIVRTYRKSPEIVQSKHVLDWCSKYGLLGLLFERRWGNEFRLPGSGGGSHIDARSTIVLSASPRILYCSTLCQDRMKKRVRRAKAKQQRLQKSTP